MRSAKIWALLQATQQRRYDVFFCDGATDDAAVGIP